MDDDMRLGIDAIASSVVHDPSPAVRDVALDVLHAAALGKSVSVVMTRYALAQRPEVARWASRWLTRYVNGGIERPVLALVRT